MMIVCRLNICERKRDFIGFDRAEVVAVIVVDVIVVKMFR